MRMSHFFIDRPIFASVISIVFVIVGVRAVFQAGLLAVGGKDAVA